MPQQTLNFELREEEIKAALLPAMGDFLNMTKQGEMSRQVARTVRQGREEAFYVPSVGLVVQSTLNMLEMPSVEERLPRNIRDRGAIATYTSGALTNIIIKMGTLPFYYTENPLFSVLRVSPDIRHGIRDKKYLDSIGGAPFFDTRVTAGGAFNFLEGAGVPVSERAEIIARSTGLLAVSGVYKGFSDEATAFLGTPYANIKHFQSKDGTEQPEVTFTDKAKARLKTYQLPDRGCPAGGITLHNEAGEEINLLGDTWSRIVRHLIPADATA